ncbi:sensor domain-containing diguanylate cyclase [Herbaspirillum sp.]|jgi:diguanylate cyclase (GGDEF)-like protein|uniref:sensor domain-containing diguanylate cyclase n=1 Tax=Herbaspirillum TaxID=963 RepID=UPI00258D8DE0|nr:sensor domain-containing diguanylate cyclase [Herbaspirillum sp.]MCP3653865.1 GGDEF domain-containing protein [Herbaspirillum sp.]MCP3947202.1 GGDEF domain-containing protein [Herbaspirillum sp.]MCP4032574.1 GGDEF domain-containing protein [Herbaspirillum sp.]MCP4555822.1 GGDEF domain-containing protein [Herbaspirillum sp.]
MKRDLQVSHHQSRTDKPAASDFPGLLQAAMDSLDSQIALIDGAGVIHYVNKSWCDFGKENGMPSGYTWIGSNYLAVCRAAGNRGDCDGRQVYAGIKSVLESDAPCFQYEYPCHSPNEQRWFMMRIAPVLEAENRYIISHNVITGRKLAEQRIERLNEKLSLLAVTDKLTGLANRMKLDDALESEITRAHRYRKKLSLVLLDVDHFKEVNDKFGHSAGDAVLVRIAEILRANVRATDVVGRWGGEEFLLILPECDVVAASRMAEKLRLIVERHSFVFVGKRTCSFGVATYQSGQDCTALLCLADSALYRAKNSGRNRVEIAADIKPYANTSDSTNKLASLNQAVKQ